MIEMRKIQDLYKSEAEQEEAKVELMMEAYGNDENEIIWDEQPAIVATEDGEILDGHHRHEAFSRLGFDFCRVLTVSEEFKARAEEIGLQSAVQDAADKNGCQYTWGAA